MLLIYSHNTPEILISSFRTKEQIKNSKFCNLVDDNLPDDLLNLKGDDLIIKEGPNTINIDMALALSFNAIRNAETAQQFGKILIANGTNVDTRTLIYYTRRINTGPYRTEVSEYFNNHFDYINGTYNSNLIPFQQTIGNTTTSTAGDVDGIIPRTNNDPIDQSFIDTIKKLSQDCLNAPCNYFDYSGSYGFLANASQTLNSTTSQKDTITSTSQGTGIANQETFNKTPPPFQKTIGKLTQLVSTTFTKFVSTFTNGANVTNRGTSAGHILAPDTSTYINYSQAQSEVLSKVANNLGDCFRLNDYRKRYNPYFYYQNGGPNAEQAAPPGITGLPVNYTKVTKNTLNNTNAGTPATFVSQVYFYTPNFSQTTQLLPSNRIKSKEYTYEQYLQGNAPYVSVAADLTVIPHGTILYNDSYKGVDGSPIPFRVTSTWNNFTGVGFNKIAIATGDPVRANSSTAQIGNWVIRGMSSQTPNPNVQNGPGDSPYNMSRQNNVVPVSQTDKEFEDYFNRQVPPFEYFKASDICVKFDNVVLGVQNSPPPRELWSNIFPTIRGLELFMKSRGVPTGTNPITVTSSYRNPAYNRKVTISPENPNGSNSQRHTLFLALDIQYAGLNEYELFYKLFDFIKIESGYINCLGLYPKPGYHMVHVDCKFNLDPTIGEGRFWKQGQRGFNPETERSKFTQYFKH